MDVQETQLQSVLAGVKQYRVPLYQRTYSWSSKQLGRLWDDIVALADEQRQNSRATHFTGSLVLSLGQVGAGGTEFLVVDGQQRLTTLTMLLCALRDHYKETEPDRPEKAARVEETYLVDRFKSGDEKYKLLPTQADRAAFRAIVGGTPEHAGTSGLLEAYRFFRAGLHRADDPEDPHDIDRIEAAVLSGLVFVSITARGDDNVYRIFESLNNTGLKLTQGDLIRNYLFMRLGTRGEDVYNDIWLDLQRKLSTNDLETLFWLDLQRTRPDSKPGDIYTAQVERMNALPDEAIVDEVRRFSDLASMLQVIRSPLHESSPAVRRQLERLSLWGLGATDALVLHLLDLRAGGVLTDDEVARGLQLLESFLVRRLVIGAPANALSRILYRAPLEIADASDAVDALHRYFSSGRKYFATDAQIIDAVGTKQFYYQGKYHQRRAVLGWLEETTPMRAGDRALPGKEHVDPSTMTIEHIMPQSPTAEWMAAASRNLGEFATFDDFHEATVHSLANLTLTAYNSELSNHPFELKRDYLRSSSMRMNMEIADRPSWDRTAIEERGRALAERIIATWTGPISEPAPESGFPARTVSDLVQAIPAGRWASYGDLAQVAGTHPVPLGQFIAGSGLPGAYRVLGRRGTISPGFSWHTNSPFQGRDPLDVLADEGVEFNAEGRASTAQRLGVPELAALIGLSMGSDGDALVDEDDERTAFLESLAKQHSAATVFGVGELIEGWERLGGHISYGSTAEPSCFLEAGTGPGRPKSIWPFTIYPYGSVEVVFQHLMNRPPFDEPELREELRERLNRVAGIRIESDRLEKRPPFQVDVLADREARSMVIETLEWFMAELARFDAEHA
ncbi:GmrSD restriction endonuclease domain-containing protein [Agromyces seonyuensis]|uniref:DUF262 domain-containing protein n=1 Tax=Agromyces seonyuensis TaxID=2662446 RepID=A0A6I4NYZ6_9MICO|nr:DUF262 domain-containing protein [Agromyces seonyuensis]MWB97655.1 DUF262 domain-containing protein [Agromyces seonyuensis]